MERTDTLRVWLLPRRRRLGARVWRHISLALMIFLSAWIMFRLARLSAGMECVWMTNGLNIAMVLCINPRRRNELLVTTFAANALVNHVGGETWMRAQGYALSNAIEVFIATFPFRKMPVQRIDLTQFRVLLKVGYCSAILGSGAALVSVFVWILLTERTLPANDFLVSWYCSDALGAIIFIPLYWSYRRKPRMERVRIFRYEVQLALLLFTAVVAALFWQTRYPFLFLLFPVLLPVIYTNAFLGAARAVLLTTVIAVVATASGHGPLMLIHTSPEGRLLVLQFYLGVVLLTAFPFAALMMEREQLVATLQRSEARYRDMARLDGLTQLPNRREFDSFLEISLQRSVRQNTPLSLLLIDIDHFKKLNDLHGHTTGDDYLRRMAVAVASAVPRKTDLVARYGGEEFAVVLDSCDEQGAMMVAERIKTTVAALAQKLVAGNRPPVSVSIGVATTHPELRTLAKPLIDAADAGLYTAKRNGRNRIERGTNLRATATAKLVTAHG